MSDVHLQLDSRSVSEPLPRHWVVAGAAVLVLLVATGTVAVVTGGSLLTLAVGAIGGAVVGILGGRAILAVLGVRGVSSRPRR